MNFQRFEVSDLALLPVRMILKPPIAIVSSSLVGNHGRTGQFPDLIKGLTGQFLNQSFDVRNVIAHKVAVDCEDGVEVVHGEIEVRGGLLPDHSLP
jgi:hypothetical protein